MKSPKIRLQKLKMYENETEKFIELCNTHIMVHNLEHVIQTTHLQKNDCNLQKFMFIIFLKPGLTPL